MSESGAATSTAPTALWAPRAWVGKPGAAHGWQRKVLLRIDSQGRWSEISTGVAQPPTDALVLPGPLLPGLVNAHSHAFQRAFAGMAERRASPTDDFWSWRERMYQVALRITPAQQQAIAAQLYLELLQGGYTQVCEFHYLQHDPGGRPYADPQTMAWSLLAAADDVGLGLTLMPTLYQRAGFTQPDLRDPQRRFASSADGVWAAAGHIQAVAASRAGPTGASRPAPLNAGLALHSLRAVAPASLHLLAGLAERFEGPIHLHIAEQTIEVNDCLAATGARPIAWLAQQGLLDARWQLVHATHALPGEISAVARSGAGVVLCPSTEANLGDGLCDLTGWLQAGVPLSVGSDSHVCRDWREELRWLEYGQRLTLRQRNVAAELVAPDVGEVAADVAADVATNVAADGAQPGNGSTAENLFNRALAGGAAAAGFARWGLTVGARADALLVDAECPALAGLPAERWLDALVFSSPTRPWARVMVAGRWVWGRDDWHQDLAARTALRFKAAMAELVKPA